MLLSIIKKRSETLHAMLPAFTPSPGLGTVDVRDVAAAHTLALFTPSAKGRYICSTQGTQVSHFHFISFL